MNRTGEMNDDDVLAGRARLRGPHGRPVPPAAGGHRGPGPGPAAPAAGRGIPGRCRRRGGRGRGRDRRREPVRRRAAAGRTPAHLAAFTLTSNADGTTTLSIHADQLFDPGALRQALAAHGIPALVTDGSFCSSARSPARLLPGGGRPRGARLRTGARRTCGLGRNPVRAVLVINGSAMPAGTELSIGYFDGHLQQAWVVLIDKDSYSCTSVRPATPPPGGLMAGWLHR